MTFTTSTKVVTYALKEGSTGDLLQSGSITLTWSPVLVDIKIYAGRKFADSSNYDVNAVDMATVGITSM